MKLFRIKNNLTGEVGKMENYGKAVNYGDFIILVLASGPNNYLIVFREENGDLTEMPMLSGFPEEEEAIAAGKIFIDNHRPELAGSVGLYEIKVRPESDREWRYELVRDGKIEFTGIKNSYRVAKLAGLAMAEIKMDSFV